MKNCVSLETIGNNAFDECGKSPSTPTLDLGDCINLKSIGYRAFYKYGAQNPQANVLNLAYCTSLTTIVTWAFMGMSQVNVIYLPSSITNIGERAF